MTLEDLILYHPNGWPIAAVDIRAKLGTTPEWATKLRRNLLAHGGAVPARYFLVITPDRVYLWEGGGTEPAELPPTHVVDAGPIFRRYFAAANLDPDAVRGTAFELVVDTWLAELTRADSADIEQGVVQASDELLRSGLVDAIRNARLEYPAAA
jgi:hypothetical protein